MTTLMQTIPKGYKQTEVGVIPADWDVKEMKDFTLSVASGKSKTTNESGDYPIYGSTGIIGKRKQADYSGDKILIARVGANAGTVNKVSGKYCVSDNTLMVTYPPEIDINFSYYQLINFRINKIIFGSGQPLVTGGQIKSLVFAIPSNKKEQSAIATALSDTDALIEKLEKLIEKKKSIKRGAMQELLTGKRRLPGFSGKWETKKLGEVAEFDHGRDLPKSDLSEDGPYKCIHYGQLFNEYKELISEIKSKTHTNIGRFYSKANDVLMPTSDVTPRGLATASCIKENGIILGGGILVIRLHSGYDGLYFSYFVSQNKNTVLRFVKGSTVFHLYANDLANFEVSFPELKEQTAIATVLTDMDVEIEKLESQLTKYQNLKQGMMQTLLTGKIRLLSK
ncbi:MAG: hypothetical protein UU41_C0019G0005 [Candidatus Roizmanbacteria bacterium GW2011_GWA1_41_13]|uniref:Type I restriction modification DNA specificity domain-containing protein n=1 Tax=Candidatus Roizmanbacteria bacterium GW2011_GWA1_41_13 TaxID=1618474 RepID=A0A0G0UYE5_9BACT|nr:MAG: hypothetical protein UU41_C0019G0005 [Candidatus Roizmanbacteria bacterium GW2011_GWA1_41_13]